MKRTIRNFSSMVLIISSMTIAAQDLASVSTSEMETNAITRSSSKRDISDNLAKDKNEAKRSLFRQNGEMVYFSLENSNNKKIKIEIRDGYDRLVHREYIIDGADVLKSFNFKKAFSGDYTIKVYKGAETFTKLVEVR